jgi:hypothetical protein
MDFHLLRLQDTAYGSGCLDSTRCQSAILYSMIESIRPVITV